MTTQHLAIMIESGVRYIVEAITAIRRDKLHSIEVKPEAQRHYNAKLQGRFTGTVWASGCKSWYLSSQGKNSTLWPGFTFQYRHITRRFDQANYRIRRENASRLPARVAVLGTASI